MVGSGLGLTYFLLNNAPESPISLTKCIRVQSDHIFVETG